MKVKHKALAIAYLSVTFLILITSFISYFAYFGYIKKHNYYEMKRSFEVVDYILKNEKANMRTTLADWAVWEDTYNFIEGLDKDYLATNLGGSTLRNINLKMMIFFNNKGKIIYQKDDDLDKEIASRLYKKFLLSEFELTRLLLKNHNGSNYNIILVRDKVFMVEISPVTRSNEETQSNGALLMVREIDERLLDYIRNVAKVTLGFRGAKESGRNIPLKSVKSDYGIRLQDNKEYLKADRIVKDIDGEDAIVFSLVKEKDDHKETIFYFKLYIVLFICLVIIIISIDIFSINKYILNRLSMLYNFMNKVAASKDTKLSIDMDGDDEFTGLANVTNRMLSELDSAYEDIKQMDERYRLIMEATNDGYLDFYVIKQEIYISPEWKEMVGYTGNNGAELYKSFLSKIHPECFKKMRKNYYAILSNNIEYFIEEYRVIKKDGGIIWVQQRGKIVERNDKNGPIRIVSTLSNITDRKKYEEEILFLSYSDKLTGLRNRAYMEMQFQYLDEDKSSNYAIIMGDLNGLKLANDSYGHREGDRLLILVSNIIKQSCANEDIIARWGGDEFVILVKNKDVMYLCDLIDKIKDKCRNIHEFDFSISIALGYALKDNESINTEGVMNLAEQRMYRNKLMENNSVRNAIVCSLTKTLHEKHSETEEHTMRIKLLSLDLGKRIGLSQAKLDELELLALLHDIGKIGIPEQILMKPSKLTEDEWRIMKTHTEIGYRIAKSTPELAHIAEDILAHHEKYDGTGYPRGLKGEEIPLLARIINIVDSFDVMIHKRIYKNSFSINYAIDELRKCAGTQFDPIVVVEFLRLIKELEG